MPAPVRRRCPPHARAARLPAEVELELDLDEAEDEASLRRKVARALGRPPEALPAVSLLRRSLDARKGRVRFHLLLGLTARPEAPQGGRPPRERAGPVRVVIVGDGPAGLFCAYELARHGVGAVVVDRGKRVQPRRRDLRALNVHGEVAPDSNYCFGEGGAGTFSDGKLYTRAHKHGNVRDVLELLAGHGAPAAILIDARPHIGSNLLPRVVTALREHLESVGTEFRFEARVADLLVDPRGGRRVAGVRLADGREIAADAVVLATGHSARDVLRLLAARGVRLEAKPFALGVRIEHPQALINHIQYGRHAGHPRLPNAAYRLACTVEERGVFSFCMCPGGFVVPAATAPEGVVLNGMSLSRRDSPYANAGLVVAVEPADWERAGFTGPLGGVELQQALEHAAYAAGGGALRAPATRATDFVRGHPSSTVPASSYRRGLAAGDVGAVLDATGVAIAAKLRRALARFDGVLRGYLTEEAVLLGVESRTSAPVRVPRDAATLEASDLRGLYPCGEGAGYAGGIMSAAVDGIRVARQVAARLGVHAAAGS
jgi:uncharacterized protein